MCWKARKIVVEFSLRVGESCCFIDDHLCVCSKQAWKKKKGKLRAIRLAFLPHTLCLQIQVERERERLSRGYSAYSRAGIYECHFFFQYIICIYIIVCMYSMYKYVYNMYIAIVWMPPLSFTGWKKEQENSLHVSLAFFLHRGEGIAEEWWQHLQCVYLLCASKCESVCMFYLPYTRKEARNKRSLIRLHFPLDRTHTTVIIINIIKTHTYMAHDSHQF